MQFSLDALQLRGHDDLVQPRPVCRSGRPPACTAGGSPQLSHAWTHGVSRRGFVVAASQKSHSPHPTMALQTQSSLGKSTIPEVGVGLAKVSWAEALGRVAEPHLKVELGGAVALAS